MERSQRFELSSLPDDINLYLEEKNKKYSSSSELFIPFLIPNSNFYDIIIYKK